MKYTLLVINDRNGTAVSIIAKLRGRKYTATGLAKREPGDVSNPVVGESLASARAFRDLAEQLEQDAMLIVQTAEAQLRHEALMRAYKPVPAEKPLLPVRVIKEKYGKEAARLAMKRRAKRK